MFVVFQGSKLQLIQSAMELKLNSVFSSATLGAGRLLPVRGAGHFAGGHFQNLDRFGGDHFQIIIKRVLLGGSFNSYESGI